MGLSVTINSFWWVFQRSGGKGSVQPMELTFSLRSKFFTDRSVWAQANDLRPFLAERRCAWIVLEDLPLAFVFALYSECREQDSHRRFMILEYYHPSEQAIRLYTRLKNWVS